MSTQFRHPFGGAKISPACGTPELFCWRYSITPARSQLLASGSPGSPGCVCSNPSRSRRQSAQQTTSALTPGVAGEMRAIGGADFTQPRPGALISAGMRNPSPISISSPQPTMISAPTAIAAPTRASAAVSSLTTSASSAPGTASSIAAITPHPRRALILFARLSSTSKHSRGPGESFESEAIVRPADRW